MRLASQHFFIYSSIYLRILIISYLAKFLGTYSLSVLMCRKAVNQSVNLAKIKYHTHRMFLYRYHSHLLTYENISYIALTRLNVSSIGTNQFAQFFAFTFRNSPDLSHHGAHPRIYTAADCLETTFKLRRVSSLFLRPPEWSCPNALYWVTRKIVSAVWGLKRTQSYWTLGLKEVVEVDSFLELGAIRLALGLRVKLRQRHRQSK